MAKINSIFLTKTAEKKKTIPFGAALTCIAHVREYPLGAASQSKQNNLASKARAS